MSQISKEGSWIIEEKSDFPTQPLCFTCAENPESSSHLQHFSTLQLVTPSELHPDRVVSSKHVAAKQCFRKSFTPQETTEGGSPSSFFCGFCLQCFCIFNSSIKAETQHTEYFIEYLKTYVYRMQCAPAAVKILFSSQRGLHEILKIPMFYWKSRLNVKNCNELMGWRLRLTVVRLY